MHGTPLVRYEDIAVIWLTHDTEIIILPYQNEINMTFDDKWLDESHIKQNLF